MKAFAENLWRRIFGKRRTRYLNSSYRVGLVGTRYGEPYATPADQREPLRLVMKGDTATHLEVAFLLPYDGCGTYIILGAEAFDAAGSCVVRASLDAVAISPGNAITLKFDL